MPGKWIRPQQVELYMKTREQGYSQVTSAAKAGISERSARSIEQARAEGPRHKTHDWRTRADPLEQVWQNELVPLLEKSPGLTAITLLEYLQERYVDEYPDNIHRTLQRRVQVWRALYGEEKEVMFRQTHEPGRQGLSDFTTLKRASITIAGVPFKHLLYHFRLAFSHWSFMKVIEGGESYTALAEGLQEALHQLGGAPREHRTDSLSAAYKNLDNDAKDDMTARYDVFCQHYGMTATRNNPGQSHENGSSESSHGHLKRRIEQALLLRESTDFESKAAYQRFIDGVVNQANRRNAKGVIIERASLLPLPITRTADYTELQAVVSTSSTIEVRRVTYTVPSRLQGQVLRIRVYDNRLVCYLGQHMVITLERIHTHGRCRARQVDYRHVIHSLVKKPQAFRYSRLREELLPNPDYQLIWKMVEELMPAREACRFIVGLLYLAATSDCEEPLAEAVLHRLNTSAILSLKALEKQFATRHSKQHEEVIIEQHSLSAYNHLMTAPAEVHYDA